MFKKMISTLIALLITVSVTTNAYAKEGVLDKMQVKGQRPQITR